MPDAPPQHPAITIEVRGLSVRTNHGVSEAEREIGQSMVFDVDLTLVACAATATDELDDTIDYGEVIEQLVEVTTARSYLTLERVAAVVAERLLDRFEASEVRVRAAKPEPPVPYVMSDAAVELTLKRPAE